MRQAKVIWAVVAIAPLWAAAVLGPRAFAAQGLEAARRDGKLTWYTSISSQEAEQIAKAFTVKTGIAVDVVRSGSERIYQRLSQELDARIKVADVASTSDEAHFVNFKARGVLAAYAPAGIEKYLPEGREKDNAYFHPWTDLVVFAYNPKLVAAADAPRKWTDLLDPKWRGKLAHSHPGYSGQVMNAMVALVKLYGWDYYRRLAANKPLIGQSIHDTAAPLISGERPVAACTNGLRSFQEMKKGNPWAMVLPDDGVVLATHTMAVMKDAPHPNAARAFMDWVASAEAQAEIVGLGLHTFRTDVAYPAGRKALTAMKLLVPDVQAIVTDGDKIKEMFREIFGV